MAKHHAQVVAPPPVIVAGVFLLAWSLHWLSPLPLVRHPVLLALAVFAFAAASALILGALGALFAGKTAILPHHETKSLITRGPYSISRNPIYTGLTLLYVATSILLATLWPLLLLPVLVLILRFGVIGREEVYLERLFGDEYRQYRAKVRRWL
jgi:protein-S-isoprenylcysteine O-methyltransferase Ste14